MYGVVFIIATLLVDKCRASVQRVLTALTSRSASERGLRTYSAATSARKTKIPSTTRMSPVPNPAAPRTTRVSCSPASIHRIHRSRRLKQGFHWHLSSLMILYSFVMMAQFLLRSPRSLCIRLCSFVCLSVTRIMNPLGMFL